jgi:hypothetical protein
MNTSECKTEEFISPEEVIDVRLGVVLAGVAVTLSINWRRVLFVFLVRRE